MDIKNIFKNLEWQDYTVVGLIVVFLVIYLLMLSPLQSLPSPIYGGDLYNHLGSMEHLLQGGSVFESGQIAGEIQWVPWLYHLYVVGFTLVTGIPLILAVGYSSLLLWIIAAIIIYLFASRFFNDKIYGLLAVLWLSVGFPIMKYDNFAYYLILPLFFFTAYLFLKTPSYKTGVFMAACYGLVGLSNTHSFIAASFFMMFFMLYYVLFLTIHIEKKRVVINKKLLLKHLRYGAIIFIIGFAIALLWWYKPIFVYHAQTVNDMQVYGFPELATAGQMIGIVLLGFKEMFLNFSTLWTAIFSLGALLGLFLLLFIKQKKTEHHFLLILSLAGFFGLVSHFITIPLLHTHLGPEFLFTRTFRVVMFFLFLFFIYYCNTHIKRFGKNISYAFFILVALIFIFLANANINSFVQSQWYIQAKNPLAPQFTITRDWILNNTKLNDVFITTNEDSFAINALTGRKMMTYRRTHTSSYTDMNQRMLDTGLILYGNNDVLRKKLIQQYNISYLYWEDHWLDMEFRYDQNGHVIGFFDPLIIDYTPEREQTLIANNVSYLKEHWYLDPTWQESFPKRDILIILPTSTNRTHPWNDELDAHLQLMMQIIPTTDPIIRTYKVTP